MSETTTESVAKVFASRRIADSKCGLADLLLELPEEADVGGNAVLPGVARAEERRDGGALVVGRAAREIAVALLHEVEGRGSPVVAIGGLDVEVVVDGDGGKLRAAVESP